MRIAKVLLVLIPFSLLGIAGYIVFLLLQDPQLDPGKPVLTSAIDAPPLGVKPPEALPLVLLDVSRDDAVKINTAIPFSKAPNPPAKPFQFDGNAIDKERALTCLTSAAYFEAGSDIVGAAAVVQVVLNRLRHPTFPKTICGVVYEGSARKTGCQFSFTCDGALARQVNPIVWNRLRSVALLAMSGNVFRPVGYATHYHTNWVVPYWSKTVDKIAQVNTHLFFRWPGWFGSPAAFQGQYVGGEIIDPRIEKYLISAKEAEAAMDITTQTEDLPAVTPSSLPPVTAVDLQGSRIRLASATNDQFAVKLEPAAFPGSYATLALTLCKERTNCEVWGWTDSKLVPRSFPLTPLQKQQASFYFSKTAAAPGGVAKWNCKEFPRGQTSQCLPKAPVVMFRQDTAAVPSAPPQQ